MKRDEIIKVLRNNEQTFVFTDSNGNDHPFQGINPNKYEAIADALMENKKGKDV